MSETNYDSLTDKLKWIFPSKKHCSISKGCIRYLKAEEQYKMDIVSERSIIHLINQYLCSLDIPAVDDPIIKLPQDPKGTLRNYYASLKKRPLLADERDIVWLKFTKNKHHIGVIGTSCDINFNNDNTSGKIICHLKELWDTTHVLVFPLCNIPNGLNRSDIESGIGNYLIANGVPILDFYSHNY